MLGECVYIVAKFMRSVADFGLLFRAFREHRTLRLDFEHFKVFLVDAIDIGDIRGVEFYSKLGKLHIAFKAGLLQVFR